MRKITKKPQQLKSVLKQKNVLPIFLVTLTQSTNVDCSVGVDIDDGSDVDIDDGSDVDNDVDDILIGSKNQALTKFIFALALKSRRSETSLGVTL